MKTFLFTLLISALALSKSSNIEIESDEKACLKGSMSMDVKVKLGKESFEFDPSCSFSFSKTFKTKSGFQCEVEAGMCSSFSPKNKFEVQCTNNSNASIPIKCKDNVKLKGKIGIKKDEKACLEDKTSMDVEVKIGGEKFKFDPSCSFSFSKDFETEEGIKCEIKAGMCSGFTPDKRIEVECDGDGKASTNVKCP